MHISCWKKSSLTDFNELFGAYCSSIVFLLFWQAQHIFLIRSTQFILPRKNVSIQTTISTAGSLPLANFLSYFFPQSWGLFTTTDCYHCLSGCLLVFLLFLARCGLIPNVPTKESEIEVSNEGQHEADIVHFQMDWQSRRCGWEKLWEGLPEVIFPSFKNIRGCLVKWRDAIQF